MAFSYYRSSLHQIAKKWLIMSFFFDYYYFNNNLSIIEQIYINDYCYVLFN